MKKIFSSLIILIICLLIGVYFFIPSEIKVTKEFIVKAPLAAVSRIFFSTSEWNNWLKDDTKAPGFEINNVTYTNQHKLTVNNGLITVYHNYKHQHLSTVNIADLATGQSVISWQITFPKTKNLITKVEYYIEAHKIKKSINSLCEIFKLYIEDSKKVYGFKTRFTTLQDSSMITTQGESFQYPSVRDIYVKIEKLEQYAAENNASITNFPMLNIQSNGSSGYRFMVALPINKRLENKGDILFKQMLPNGNFLCSDSIYGGFSKLDNLFINFENYRKDLNIMSPAIPFQSLITDRRREGDTTKWLTKFYYPIF